MSVSLQELLAENTMPAAPALVQQEAEDSVRCLACAHTCRIKEGKRGVCKVRFRVSLNGRKGARKSQPTADFGLRE